jgi:hypothetical protein
MIINIIIVLCLKISYSYGQIKLQLKNMYLGKRLLE